MKIPVFDLDRPFFGLNGLVSEYVDVLAYAIYLKKTEDLAGKNRFSRFLFDWKNKSKYSDDTHREAWKYISEIFQEHKIKSFLMYETDYLYSTKDYFGDQGNLEKALTEVNVLFEKNNSQARIRGALGKMDMAEVFVAQNARVEESGFYRPFYETP